MTKSIATLSAPAAVLKRFFCGCVVAAGLLVAGHSAPEQVELSVSMDQPSSLASMEFGSVDDLVQSMTPRAKMHRAAPNTWSSRFETRFKARWSGSSNYMV